MTRPGHGLQLNICAQWQAFRMQPYDSNSLLHMHIFSEHSPMLVQY